MGGAAKRPDRGHDRPRQVSHWSAPFATRPVNLLAELLALTWGFDRKEWLGGEDSNPYPNVLRSTSPSRGRPSHSRPEQGFCAQSWSPVPR